MLARFWSGQQLSALSRMAASNDWGQMDLNLESFRIELRRNTAESFLQKVAASRKHVRQFLDRVMRPTGGWIAFIGPDGCGKSLVIEAIRRQFSQTFRDVRCFHLRPAFLHFKSNAEGLVTDPHGKPPRGRIASVIKIFYFVADYFLGYLFQLVPAMIRTHLIIFDRYIDDLLVDSKRVRYSGPQWLLQLAARIVPRPDLVVLLDAPAEVLWSRKQEVPFKEVVRQRDAYLSMAHNRPSILVINAAQPVSGVVHDVMDVLIAHFSRRTTARLKLQALPFRADEIEPDTSNSRC
jgi:thymidylate kinase